jgi:hypothetical protein
VRQQQSPPPADCVLDARQGQGQPRSYWKAGQFARFVWILKVKINFWYHNKAGITPRAFRRLAKWLDLVRNVLLERDLAEELGEPADSFDEIVLA